ncbi:matrixin family metalloprotease [Tumebacillus avium]|nr:matrixin family metalloprotease [Tumebacillus avium]
MRKTLITIMIGSAGLVLGSATAAAFTYSNYGLVSVPTQVYAYSGFATETKSAIYTSCITWNGAGEGTLVLKNVNDHSNTAFPLENNRNQITSGQRGTGNYLMLTASLVDSTNHTVEADIDINTSYPWKNDGSLDAYDIGNGITHEIGHLLGLDHSSDSAATMYGTSPKGETKKRTIEQDDRNGIDFLYSPSPYKK